MAFIVPKIVRQSVSIPDALAAAVRRVADAKHLTFGAALAFFAKRGARAEREAREALRRNYRHYLKEQSPQRELQVGDDLIRSIFGTEATA